MQIYDVAVLYILNVKSKLRYANISTPVKADSRVIIPVPYSTVPCNTESYFYIYYRSNTRTTAKVPEH